MALGAQVDTKRPLKVVKEDGETTIVTNITTPTVYYRQGSNGESVSSSLNDGSLAKGATLTVTQPTFLIATEPAAMVEIATKPSPGSFSEEVITVVEAGKFNVKNPAYAGGAVGNGVTNDNAAIKAAIEAVKAAGGGTLLFPAGKYLVNEVVNEFKGGDAPVILEGVGRQATELIKATTGNTPVVKFKSTTAGEFICNSQIRNMSIFGKASEGPGIVFENCAYTKVINCQFFSTSVGWEAKGLVSASIEDCVFFNNNLKGIVLTKGEVGCNSVGIRRCVISNCKKAGIEADWCPNLLIDTCDLESNGEAGKTATGAIRILKEVKKEFGVGQVLMKHCWLEGNFGRAITVESGDIRMDDSLIFQTDEATTTTQGRDFFIPSGAEASTWVAIANCQFPTTIETKNQIVIEPATVKGEISNPLFNQLYNVPETVIVKQGAYYTSPIRMSTSNLGSPIQLEVVGSGLAIQSATLNVKTAGKGLAVKEGANCKQGVSKLVAGKVEVANTSVTASSRIFVTAQEATTGFVFVEGITAGVKFIIKSSQAADTQNVAWEIFEPSE